MKRAVILFFATVLAASHAAGQGAPQIRERVYVHTDKDMYIAGEMMWFSLLTTDERGVPLDFSRVAYVEIVDGASAAARAMVGVTGGVGDGCLVIPAGTATGLYRLVAYTRQMRNEGEAVFFEKPVSIVNPTKTEDARAVNTGVGVVSREELATARGRRENSFRMTSLTSTFAPRSRVDLMLDGLPADLQTLSLSVAGYQPRPMYVWNSDRNVSTWSEGLAAQAGGTVDDELLAEIEGHIVTARVTDAATGSPAAASRITFPGDAPQYFAGRQADGVFSYFTRGTAGSRDMVLNYTPAADDASYGVDVLPPWAAHSGGALPALDLGELDLDKVLEQSVGVQVQYSYVNDSLGRLAAPEPWFVHPPDKRYVMADYVQYATMQEVVIEYVTAVRFGRIGGRRYLNTLRTQSEMGFSQGNSLVLLDGILVPDHEAIFKYNPLLLERIDVYFDRYTLGGNSYEGIVAFYTGGNNYPDLALDDHSVFVEYPGPQLRRAFWSPAYEGDGERASRVPDFRHTLYWNPAVRVDGQPSRQVTFYTSDLRGEFDVVAEGITQSGRAVRATYRIRVE